MNKVTSWGKENRHQAIAWQVRYLNAMLQGHYNYYGISGNFKSVAAYYRHVVKVWHRYLSRRSQRAKLSWEKYIKKAYLPNSMYTAQRYFVEEPDAGNLQVRFYEWCRKKFLHLLDSDHMAL
jgi:hypothetical protein